MASPRIVRQALGTRLRSIAGLTVYDRWPSQVQLPAAILRPGMAEHEQTFGRGDLTKWPIDVYVFVSLAPGLEQSQDNLDPLLATSSTGGIYGAIQADRTLGGVVSTTFVQNMHDYDQFDADQSLSYAGAIVSVECWST